MFLFLDSAWFYFRLWQGFASRLIFLYTEYMELDIKSKKRKISIIRNSAAEYLTFVTASGESGVEAIYADENVWITQKMMAVLYNVTIST
jgi:hypothetical protein